MKPFSPKAAFADSTACVLPTQRTVGIDTIMRIDEEMGPRLWVQVNRAASHAAFLGYVFYCPLHGAYHRKDYRAVGFLSQPLGDVDATEETTR